MVRGDGAGDIDGGVRASKPCGGADSGTRRAAAELRGDGDRGPSEGKTVGGGSNCGRPRMGGSGEVSSETLPAWEKMAEWDGDGKALGDGWGEGMAGVGSPKGESACGARGEFLALLAAEDAAALGGAGEPKASRTGLVFSSGGGVGDMETERRRWTWRAVGERAVGGSGSALTSTSLGDDTGSVTGALPSSSSPIGDSSNSIATTNCDPRLPRSLARSPPGGDGRRFS
mmetsp:Transcript_23011/g.53779  ORF Transcript_23011/g.53779 Transcript_23011/m.53779 type:complete len:229 (-) Transcript_23011:5140-5826(-)